MAATSSALAWVGGQPGDALQYGAAFLIAPVQFGAAAVQVLAGGQGRALVDPLELGVQPGFPLGQPRFPALQVGAQFAGLIVDRAQFLFRFPAGLGGLVGLLAASGQDARGFGLGAGADLVRFLAGSSMLGAAVCWAGFPAARPGGSAGDLRSTTTSAKTTASKPMALNASEIVLLTDTPIRRWPRGT